MINADSRFEGVVMKRLMFLRYDLIDRPRVLGNYVLLNYHCLYDLSAEDASCKFWYKSGVYSGQEIAHR